MKINFESSTACNARCTFCPRYEMTRPRGEMSDELFYKIIRDGKAMGIRSYSPFMNGEPFVFPRIWQWLDYMEKERVKVSLFTNAEYMDVDRLIKYKNILYVNCSINAASRDTYNKVMRGPDYDKVISNTNELLNKAPFHTRASFIITEDNVHEVEEFKKMYRGNKRKINGFANWTGDKHSSLARVGNRIPCYVLLNQIFILWDGRMVPCCMDWNCKMTLGDVNTQTIKEVWDSYTWMREKHNNCDFDIPICIPCNYNVDG